MRTLFAFGDSYTYGHGLEDCIFANNMPGPDSSKFAWPAVLGEELGYKIDNRSQPGLSNLGILHKILNTNFEENSLCIIMWSVPQRDMIFDKKYIPLRELFNRKKDTSNSVIHIGNWIEDELAKYWMLTHNDTDLKMRSWLHIHHANLYLNSLTIPHYNFFINYPSLREYKPKYCNIPFKDISVQKFIDRALDNNHPGPLTQQRIAKDIKQCLIEASII